MKSQSYLTISRKYRLTYNLRFKVFHMKVKRVLKIITKR